MGLTVRQMLNSNSFTNFNLIAGKNGLDNKIQGIAILDAPDGIKWTKGKEFVLTSGYLFKEDKEYIHRFVNTPSFKLISCMGIKTRYIDSFPEDILEEFNRYSIPLFIVPDQSSWMDIANNLNVLVMNRNIKQFNIGSINPMNASNISYQERKIYKILSKMEVELNFPAMLYDLENDKAYYSSNSFNKLAEHRSEEEFWNPTFDYEKDILCDNLKMVRYKFTDKERFKQPFSWITIPIKVGDSIKAYFVLVEETELIDYFDQFSIRIGFLLIQSLYEQVNAVRIIMDRGFEKFIVDVLSGYLKSDEEILKRALELDINERNKYYMILAKEINGVIDAFEDRTEIRRAMSSFFEIDGFRAGILNQDSLLILVPVNGLKDETLVLNSINKEILKLKNRLEFKISGTSFIFALSDYLGSIYDIKRNYHRCEQTIKMGQIIYPKKAQVTYSELGPFAWMDIKDDELNYLKEKLDFLSSKSINEDLIGTLKTYLECNMNFSSTAKSMYLHINTVRKRIGRIVEIMEVDLTNPIERLNLEILLELI